MTDRDTFAAAALTGLLACPLRRTASEMASEAYAHADAMLRERGGVTEPLTKEKRAEVSSAPVSRPAETRQTNHDAAPAAKARTESAAGEPGGGGGCGGTDKPVTLPAMGTGDIRSSPAIAQPPASRQPNRDGMAGSGEGQPLDDTRPDTKGEATGGRGHFPDSRTRLSEADSLEAIARGEVDSPQPVAAAYAVYFHGEYDSSYGPDAIDEALEIAAECNGEVVPLYRTPQSYAKNDEKRVVSDMRNGLSGAEREAIREALVGAEQDARLFGDEAAKADAAALRGLLERTK